MSELVEGRDPRYPIGKPQRLSEVRESDVRAAIQDLAGLPGMLRNGIDGLDAKQLQTPYREGGWTLQQLVHHVADSHMNAFVRVRLALTEENPVITAYDERAWAELEDSLGAPVAWSLGLLEGLHGRWVMMLEGLEEEQWGRVLCIRSAGRRRWRRLRCCMAGIAGIMWRM